MMFQITTERRGYDELYCIHDSHSRHRRTKSTWVILSDEGETVAATCDRHLTDFLREAQAAYIAKLLPRIREKLASAQRPAPEVK